MEIKRSPQLFWFCECNFIPMLNLLNQLLKTELLYVILSASLLVDSASANTSKPTFVSQLSRQEVIQNQQIDQQRQRQQQQWSQRQQQWRQDREQQWESVRQQQQKWQQHQEQLRQELQRQRLCPDTPSFSAMNCF